MRKILQEDAYRETGILIWQFIAHMFGQFIIIKLQVEYLRQNERERKKKTFLHSNELREYHRRMLIVVLLNSF